MGGGSPLIYMSSLGFRLCIDTLTHPLEYAKFLIQIGHEPLPPYPTRTIFGRPTMGLPNCFKYVQYIKKMDGLSGCFRGCVPKLMGRTIGSIVAKNAVSYLEPEKEVSLTEDEKPTPIEISEDDKVPVFLSTLAKDITGRTCLVFVSHPFLVISNRMMAQFVGGEDTYSGILSSIGEIYREQGILGFFSGVMPRWVGDLIYLTLSSLCIYGISSYLVADNELRSITTPLVQFVTSPLVYHFNVVSSCMSINNCGLQAGIPPNMPIYKSWWSCRQHLAMNGQLNRGSSMIIRYYIGPPAGAKALVSY